MSKMSFTVMTIQYRQNRVMIMMMEFFCFKIPRKQEKGLLSAMYVHFSSCCEIFCLWSSINVRDADSYRLT